ncbi:MAG: ABC transporter substrate-binding protein [Nevskia sp.]
MLRAALLLLAVFVPAFAAQAADGGNTIRIGVLQFGAVSWTLDAMQHQGYDQAHGVKLEIVPMAASNAAQIALQGGAVDMITSDWLWVARNRAEGRAYQFAGNSTSLGALYAKPDSGIAKLADLKGREFGVAGSPVDKSWLLLQAYAKKNDRLDLAKEARPSFAAPPALNELLNRGRLAAVLNFWPYGARLQAAGMKTVIDMRQVLAGLGVEKPVAMVGWVFAEKWAQANPALLNNFLAASAETNNLLRNNDAEWTRLRPLMKADSEADFTALREAYRDGVVPSELRIDVAVMRRLYALLAAEGGEALVGKATTLDPGSFYAATGDPGAAKSR